MADQLVTDIEHLLLVHREASPLCDECRQLDFPKWRRHLAETIADKCNRQHRRQPNAVLELLAERAPFHMRGGGLACNECCNGRGAGEYQTTVEWARHVCTELTKAGLKVTNAKAP